MAQTTEFVYSPKHRILSVTMPVLSTVGLLGFTWHTLKAAEKGRLAPSALSGEEYRQNLAVFSLVNVFSVMWTGGGARAEVAEPKGAEYPLAYITKKLKTSKTTFLGTSCALKFKMEARKGNSWVILDDIVAEVSSYDALPKYEPLLPRPFQEAEVYYLELDRPSAGSPPSPRCQLAAGSASLNPQCTDYGDNTCFTSTFRPAPTSSS